MRVLDPDLPVPFGGNTVCEKGYRGKVVIFQEPANVDVEPIAYDFQIDPLAETIVMESPEVGINERSLYDEVLHLLGSCMEYLGYSAIGLARADFPLPILLVDLLIIPTGKGAQELVAHIPDANSAVEIAEDEVKRMKGEYFKVKEPEERETIDREEKEPVGEFEIEVEEKDEPEEKEEEVIPDEEELREEEPEQETIEEDDDDEEDDDEDKKEEEE